MRFYFTLSVRCIGSEMTVKQGLDERATHSGLEFSFPRHSLCASGKLFRM